MSKENLRIGMLHAVAAPITSEVEGQAIVYGTGMAVANAVAASITWNRADTSHYGDDVEDARDNGILNGDISFTNSGLYQEARTMILGDKQQGQTSEYEVSAEATPSVGFGYIRVMRKNGQTAYEGIWMHKVQFAEDTIEDNTKGESISWGETTLTGRIMPVRNTASLETHVMVHQEFTTLTAADAWLNGKANISASSSSSPVT